MVIYNNITFIRTCGHKFNRTPHLVCSDCPRVSPFVRRRFSRTVLIMGLGEPTLKPHLSRAATSLAPSYFVAASASPTASASGWREISAWSRHFRFGNKLMSTARPFTPSARPIGLHCAFLHILDIMEINLLAMRFRDRTPHPSLGPDYYLKEDVDEPIDNGASSLSVVSRDQLNETMGKWKELCLC